MINTSPASAIDRLRARLKADHSGPSDSLSLWAGLTAVELAPSYVLSAAQERMLVLDALSRDALSYNLPFAVELIGQLDVDRLSEAVRHLGCRHESLRTAFGFEGDQPVQRVVPDAELRLEVLPSGRLETPLVARFDLGHPPLARVRLIQLADTRHVLQFDIHHIIADGLSLRLLMRDLLAFYTGKDLASLRLQYKDFAVWQRKWLDTPEADAQAEFWSRTFQDGVPGLDLPTDFVRPLEKDFRGARIQGTLAPTLCDSIQTLARDLGTTPFVILLGGLSVLLGKLAGQEDVVVGAPHAGRTHTLTRDIVGLFVNTLLYRSRPRRMMPVCDFLAEFHRTALEVLDRADYPFDRVVGRLSPERRAGSNPLFNVMMSFQNFAPLVSDTGPIAIREYPTVHAVSNFDLELYASDQGGQIDLVLEYSTQLFEQSTVRLLLGMFTDLLQQMVDDPARRLGDIRMLGEQEEAEVLDRFAGPARGASGATVVDLFRATAARVPDRLAATCEDERLTYADLDRASDTVAARLGEHGVGPETLVALVMERSLPVLTCMLGVLKAGAAFVPIDPELPATRIGSILSDSMAGLVVVNSLRASQALGTSHGKAILLVSELLSGPAPSRPPAGPAGPVSLAYVIYTSGSTGRPKGVMVEHGGLLNHLEAKVDVLGLMDSDVVSQTATISFDIAVWQFLAALCVGGRTVVLPGDCARDPAKLVAAVKRDHLTVLELVPSHFEHWLDRLEKDSDASLHALRWILLTGEALPASLCRRWFARGSGIPLINAYGPTECSDDVTQCTLRGEDDLPFASAPIHGTVRNTQLYVLDPWLQPVPAGAVGELFVGGVAVGRGYLKDPVRTGEAFLPDPFATRPGQRMYRTGDQVRYRTSGKLEFLGRVDDQVKLRGYRIQLGEIEAALLAVPGCRAAAVVTDDGQGDPTLVAYVVGELPPSNMVESILRTRLPAYMVPTSIVALEQLPLLSNGKLDRKSLPRPTREQAQRDFTAPQTLLERRILSIWEQILGSPSLSLRVRDNFFKVGGDSLKAMRLATQLNAEFGTDLSFGEVFIAPTVEGLAWQVETALGTVRPTSLGRPTLYPAILAQRQILVGAEPGTTTCNMPAGFLVQGAFDPHRAGDCLRALAARHEILRARFTADGSGWWPEPPEAGAAVVVRPFAESSLEAALKSFVRPFDLTAAAPFRAEVQHGRENIILIDLHAVAADALSKLQLFKEFRTLYNGETLPNVAYGFADYALRQAQGGRADMRILWDERLQIPSVPLAVWTEAGYAAQSREGTRASTRRAAGDLVQLEALAGTWATTLHSLVFAAGAAALVRHFNQRQDFVVICPVADRGQLDLRNAVGLLVQNMPVLVRISEAATLGSLCESLHEELAWTYGHLGPEAEEVLALRRAELVRHGQHALEPVLVWVDERVDTAEGHLGLVPIPHWHRLVRHDLRLEVHAQDDGLLIVTEGRDHLFPRAVLEALLKAISVGLDELLREPCAPVLAEQAS